MNDTLQVFRSELKYVLPAAKISNLKFELSKLLSSDTHSSNGEYPVRSLYFDSINDIDFNTKMAGTEVRKKVRMRAYEGNNETCKIELKNKNGDSQHKISMWITREDAQKLIDLDYSVLLNYADKDTAALLFYKTMQLGCYKPVVMIEYTRAAYTSPINDTRITFDSNVRSSECDFDLFSDNPNYTQVIDETIVEVKYNGKLLNSIQKVLSKYSLNQVSVSKYCFGRKNFYYFN